MDPGLVGRARRRRVTTVGGTDVPVTASEHPVTTQVLDERLPIVRPQDGVQRSLPGALGEQFAGVACVVRLRRSAANRSSRQRTTRADVGFSVDEGLRIGIDEDLDRYGQLAAVVESRAVLGLCGPDPRSGRDRRRTATAATTGEIRVLDAAAHAPATTARRERASSTSQR